MKLDNSVKKKVIWNTNTIGGMFHVILGWKIELSLGWCYNYFLGSITLMQSRETGIADHVLPLGDWF